MEKEGHPKTKPSSKKGLWTALCGLVILIVGLVTANIIIGNSNQNETTFEGDDDESYMTVGAEWAEEYDEFEAMLDNVTEKAKEIIGKGDYNIEDVYKLYDDIIEKYISQERFDYAWAFAKGEMNTLLDVGLKNEALQALMRVDYNRFPTARRYECCMEIAKLAESVDNKEAQEKYEKLAAEYEEEWVSVQKATAEAATEFEAEIENAEEEPDW